MNSYLNALQRSWSGKDGELVATLLSLRDRHSNNHHLQNENPENAVERICYAPLDEIVSAHIKVLYYLSRKRESCSRQVNVLSQNIC